MANIIDVGEVSSSSLAPGMFDLNLFANNGGSRFSKGIFPFSDYSFLIFVMNSTTGAIMYSIVDCATLLFVDTQFNTSSGYSSSVSTISNNFSRSFGASSVIGSIAFNIEDNTFTISSNNSNSLYFGRMFKKQ